MTHSLSVTGADKPPAMKRKATLAIVVSSTSMKVGTTTASAISQGLTDRCARGTSTASVVMAGLLARRLWGPLRPIRLQYGTRARPGRCLVHADVWRHGQANKQRRLGWIVVDQLNPHGQPLHHLDEVPRRVLWRQQRQC